MEADCSVPPSRPNVVVPTKTQTPTMGKNKNAGKPRNYALECGVYRFGKGKMYHKKAIYKFNKKAAPVKAATPKPTFVEKPVKGAKNGETRMVRVKRLRNDVPTVDIEASWNFSELFLQAQEVIEGYFDSRQNLHSSCWCSQGQACCCPQTARLWTRPHYRTNEIEWMPHASSQPDLLVGYRNLH